MEYASLSLTGGVALDRDQSKGQIEMFDIYAESKQIAYVK